MESAQTIASPVIAFLTQPNAPLAALVGGIALGCLGQSIFQNLARRPFKTRAVVSAFAVLLTLSLAAYLIPLLLQTTFPSASEALKDWLPLMLGAAIPAAFSKAFGFAGGRVRIAYVMRNGNTFHTQIKDGFEEECDKFRKSLTRPIDVESFVSADVESLSQQLEVLRSINAFASGKFWKHIWLTVTARILGRDLAAGQPFDAVIIMSADPEQLGAQDVDLVSAFYGEVGRLLDDGVIVVSIDTKLAKERLAGFDTRYLGYVTSDYWLGGALVADRIIEIARDVGEAKTAAVLGSVDVIHEEVRQKEILHALMRNRFRGRLVPCPLPRSWDPEDCSGQLLQAVLELRAAPRAPQNIIVYACDDNIANELSKRLSREHRLGREIGNIAIIGYNGQMNGNHYLLHGQPFIDSTVDVEVSRQGAHAFQMVAEALFDRRLPSRNTRYTIPQMRQFLSSTAGT